MGFFCAGLTTLALADLANSVYSLLVHLGL